MEEKFYGFQKKLENWYKFQISLEILVILGIFMNITKWASRLFSDDF